MNVTTYFCVLVVSIILVLYMWKISNWLWFKPKKIEKILQKQNLKGSPYKFMFGDLKEAMQMMTEAISKPISLTDDIVPRVSPFIHKSLITYGNCCFTWAGTKPVVYISEPAMIQEVLANHTKYQKPNNNPLTKLLVTGIVDAEADQWVKRRKIVSPAFHVEKLKHMVPAFYASCNEMMDKWEEMITTESSCEVDVWPYLQTFSADVISCTAFGSNFEEGSKIFELQRIQSNLAMEALNSGYIPGSRFLPTKRNKRMKEINQEVNKSIKSIINNLVVAMKAGQTRNDNLLGILLNSNYDEIKQHGNKSSGLSIDEIVEECKVFYIAGQETTSVMLVWTMILLGKYTDWQTRAREEVRHVFGDKSPDADGLSHLKVIHMIFNEVVRLYPPVISQSRITHEETKLGNLTLPAGTVVEINAMILHRDKNKWGEDALEFKPERFSQGVLKATKGQATYIPFSDGPRICIGQNFAMLEAKMALALILQRFSFELSPSYSHAPHNILSLQPQFGAHLILHKH